MSYKSMLNLKATVQIRKVTETPDGFGALSSATVVTTLTRAAIWQTSGNDNYLSDKIYKASSHVLAVLPAEYDFTFTDEQVLYDSKTFELIGHENDVSEVGKVKIIGMNRLE